MEIKRSTNQTFEPHTAVPTNSSDEQQLASSLSLSTPSILTVPVKNIKPYDKNPRRMEHPKYEAIKESIYNDGMIQPIVITRKPGEKKFMIFKGGNTRLTIVRELYDATGDSRFESVDCSFQPWTGNEVDAIIGHLKENEMRNSLCFIDRAHGVKTAIEYLKQEKKAPLSLRSCLNLLVEKGFSTSLSTLSVMLYATDFVEPWLAKDVCKKMGRPQFQKIRSLEKAFNKVCDEFQTPKKVRTEMFQSTLQKFNEPEWANQVFRRTLELAVAKNHGVSIQDISIRLAGYLHHSLTLVANSVTKVYSNPNNLSDSIQSEGFTSSTENPSVYSVNTPISTKNPYLIGEITLLNQKFLQSEQERSSTQSINSRTSQYSKAPKPRSSKDSSEVSGILKKIGALRTDAHRLAWRLGKQYKIHRHPVSKKKIIQETKNWGLGYLIVDYPPEVNLSDLNQVSIREAVWWILLEFSDLLWAVECARPTVAKIIGSTDICHFVKSGNSATLSLYAKLKMKCAYPHLGLFSYCLRQLDDESLQNLNQLNFTYRALHQIARVSNTHLFKTQ